MQQDLLADPRGRDGGRHRAQREEGVEEDKVKVLEGEEEVRARVDGCDHVDGHLVKSSKEQK